MMFSEGSHHNCSLAIKSLLRCWRMESSGPVVWCMLQDWKVTIKYLLKYFYVYLSGYYRESKTDQYIFLKIQRSHPTFLACLFRRKSPAVVIIRSLSSLLLLLLSCKNLNVTHYLKSIKDINTKLGMQAHNYRLQLQDKGHISESYNFGAMPIFN